MAKRKLFALFVQYNVYMNIEFVSYSGKYPCLCMGKLVVKLDGKEASFGDSWNVVEKGDYPSFWTSGGHAGFVDWEPYVTQGPWKLDAYEKNYPEDIWKMLPELIDLMNAHVPDGCCGGCL